MKKTLLVFLALLVLMLVFTACGEDETPPPETPGLYDKKNNLIATWDELVNTYGMKVDVDYSNAAHITNQLSPSYVLTKTSALKSGRKLVLGDITKIGKYAFYSCESLKSITIPGSVASIGMYAFAQCESLKSVTINDGVASIGGAVFEGCTSLKSITIPNSVTSYDGGGFSTLRNLVYNKYDNAKYLGNKSNPYLVLVDIIDSTVSSFNIHPDTRFIDHGAFYKCEKLNHITIPDSVTSIGGGAFGSCTSLASITIPNSVTSIGWGAFESCTSLASITIPNSVTSIGGGAFESCTSLASITIPDSVTSIGENTFGSCTSLASVTIGKGVTWVGEHVFCYCQKLKTISFNGTTAEWSAIEKGSRWNRFSTVSQVVCSDGTVNV